MFNDSVVLIDIFNVARQLATSMNNNDRKIPTNMAKSMDEFDVAVPVIATQNHHISSIVINVELTNLSHSYISCNTSTQLWVESKLNAVTSLTRLKDGTY